MIRTTLAAAAHSQRGTCDVRITLHGQVHEDEAAARFGLSTLTVFEVFEDGTTSIEGTAPCQ